MSLLDKDSRIIMASELAREYKLKEYHCSESAIRACAQALDIDLPEGVIKAACGFRGGGGGYLDRCGIIEAGSMLISYLYGRTSPDEPDWPYSYLICLLHDRFKVCFGSIYCRDIFPEASKDKSLPSCINTYTQGCEIITKLLLEVDELLDNAPEIVRQNGVFWKDVVNKL